MQNTGYWWSLVASYLVIYKTCMDLGICSIDPYKLHWMVVFLSHGNHASTRLNHNIAKVWNILIMHDGGRNEDFCPCHRSRCKDPPWQGPEHLSKLSDQTCHRPAPARTRPRISSWVWSKTILTQSNCLDACTGLFIIHVCMIWIIIADFRIFDIISLRGTSMSW